MATQYNGVSRNQNRSNINKQDKVHTERNAIHAEEVQKQRTYQEIFVYFFFPPYMNI